MHILLTNDDGPPNPVSSPYISAFIDELRTLNHEVSVVLPSTQRSWIGKAHLLPPSRYTLPGQERPHPNEVISELCTPTYFDPETGTVHDYPPEGKEYWVLVPGAPLGLFHHKELFPFKTSSKIDLVLSGPNHGRNTTAAFALSSGTLGGALEAAISGVKAIAISFAFFTKTEPEQLVREASAHALRIVEKLYGSWSPPLQSKGSRLSDGRPDPDAAQNPDVFTINVPLVEGVSQNPVKWTWMLDNKWPDGSLYSLAPSPPDEHKPPSFKWSPSFGTIWQAVEESPPGNDGRAIKEGFTSVGCLKAKYEEIFGGSYSGDFKL
ncbi:MAG: hypothetical protein Q9159_003515 [Coniocarpon cinnabarinum]